MIPIELVVTRRQWLGDHAFEVCFERPANFNFTPGQKIRFDYEDISREYTLVNGPMDDLTICVRLLRQGRFSPVLARAEKGDRFQISPAFGYFVQQPSRHPAVYAATGTGVAPFVSFALHGVRNFYLLHGVRTAQELYYRDILECAADHYIPCLSKDRSSGRVLRSAFAGRVTGYLESSLPKGVYDFYLCGRGEMIADATRIIDTQFVGSKVFTETFY